MTVSRGMMGQTVSDMRPFGEVEIEGRVYPAKAQAGWIDKSVEIVVVRSGSFGIVVREREGAVPVDQGSSSRGGTDRSQPESSKDTIQSGSCNVALDGPYFWLERVNLILFGGVLWTVIGTSLLLTGLPINLELVLLPFGGAISGAICQYFIRGARDLEGPYVDHRPLAYFFAKAMITGAVTAVAAVFFLGGGIATMTGGLVVGTLGGLFLAVGFRML